MRSCSENYHKDCYILKLDIKGYFMAMNKDFHDWFLYGGEDYELLFAASSRFTPASVPNKSGISLSRIGTFTDRVKGVLFKNINGTMVKVEKTGWDHLS